MVGRRQLALHVSAKIQNDILCIWTYGQFLVIKCESHKIYKWLAWWTPMQSAPHCLVPSCRCERENREHGAWWSRLHQSHNSIRTTLKQGATPGDEVGTPNLPSVHISDTWTLVGPGIYLKLDLVDPPFTCIWGFSKQGILILAILGKPIWWLSLSLSPS